jgi:hypothetical protein
VKKTEVLLCTQGTVHKNGRKQKFSCKCSNSPGSKYTLIWINFVYFWMQNNIRILFPGTCREPDKVYISVYHPLLLIFWWVGVIIWQDGFIYISCLFIHSFIHQWFYSHLLGPGLFFSFVIFFTQTIGLLGRVISPSLGLYLHTEQHKHRIKAHRHPRLEWDSNPWSQSSSEGGQFMT